ncbi:MULTISPECIES: protein-glutamine gamma-glutamyltransferase [unclassified Sporolactobacillus]|uniref:protein-glutamine gamma-glutamyltransferase n=1 Tax=unclassified Sporolactobacillus TaxID=2628533 RepID=UPI0023681A75|nr:protein-glutamine gamma-glutamyltransferase [Sporolactobacillus sp. CQH2019]MDD9148823.1 protein-glutamine gamma-glutamyltransferase [Sporolactobacillus sp. CQH2019]
MIIVEGQTLTADAAGSFSAIGANASKIFQAMSDSSEMFVYPSRRELTFEIKFRSETIAAARALQNSRAAFATFYYSACNELFWSLTGEGGFELRPGRQPSEAIRDIFRNGDAYAFECATAMMIVFYKALIETVREERFNAVFQHLYLWDWQNHPFFPLRNINHVGSGIPGDIRYFKNPEVNPQTPQWQGENAVDLSNHLYFGHGIGILPAEQIIAELNKYRRRGAEISAFLMPGATRPDYLALSELDAGGQTDVIRIAAGTSTYTF